MLQRIQVLNRGQRVLVFVLIFGGGLLLLAALVVFLILLSFNSAERRVAVPVAEGVAVEEYATLPDDDAFPASLAIDAEGRVYTASQATGTLWRIDPDTAEVTEMGGTRERVGAVTALAFAPDGTLYLLDRLTRDFRSSGGAIWQVTLAGGVVIDLDTFGAPDGIEDLVTPEDIAVDADGLLYVVDRGRREVWRFDRAGEASLWWEVPPDDERAGDVLPNGIAYDATTQTMVISATGADAIYRVSLDGATTEVLYRHTSGDAPGFDGLTVAPDGSIYVAAVDLTAVVRVDGPDTLTVLAENFRGASDLAYRDGQLYVTNFDSRALALPGINPQLPFALDVLTLDAGTE